MKTFERTQENLRRLGGRKEFVIRDVESLIEAMEAAGHKPWPEVEQGHHPYPCRPECPVCFPLEVAPSPHEGDYRQKTNLA